MQTEYEIKELVEECDSLVNSGEDCAGCGDFEAAAEYFSDACYVLNKIEDEELRNKIAEKYLVNPFDFEV